MTYTPPPPIKGGIYMTVKELKEILNKYSDDIKIKIFVSADCYDGHFEYFPSDCIRYKKKKLYFENIG